MKVKVFSTIAAVLAAAACASTPEPAPEQTPAPTATPPASQPAAIQSAPIPGTIADFIETAGDRVFFDYDSFTLRADARRTLDRQAAWLQGYPNVQILVAGNADERGTREYNIALGARRANAVKDYLLLQGVEASRITTISYGKERPIDPRSNEEAWAQNRNSHTQILSGEVG